MRFNFNVSVNPVCNTVVPVHNSGVINTPEQVVTKRIELPNMNVCGNIECSVKDLADLWDLQKKVLKESPEVAEEFMKSIVDKIGVFKELIGRIEDATKFPETDDTIEAVSDDTNSKTTVV